MDNSKEYETNTNTNTNTNTKTKYNNILSEHDMFKSIHEKYKENTTLHDLIVVVKTLENFHQVNVTWSKK